MNNARQLLTPQAMQRSIDRMAAQLIEITSDDERPALIGIRTHGVTLARRMAQLFQQRYAREIPVGILDITLYRDDINLPGTPQPIVRPTQIDFDLNDRVVFLVDDVLYTGRTIRCALDEIMDFGRPRCIKLAVLVDRGGRELPIQPDVTGIVIPAAPGEKVDVCFQETGSEDGVWVHPRAT